MTSAIDLVGILEDAGVQNLKEGPKEVSGSCPQHMERLGKIDTHSSWSINRFTYLHHCFSCGYSGTITGLLIDILGYAPDNLEEELSKTSFLSNMAKVREREETPPPPPEEAPIDQWVLTNSMRDVPQRLIDFRHLQRKAVDTYGVRWDTDRKSWVLPIRTHDGDLLGAQFRQKGNELNLPKGLEKSLALFGLDVMRMFDTVAVVESPLDAVRMFGVGIPTVSSFGAWISGNQCRLLSRNFTRVILALDNDRPGREGAARATQTLKRLGVGVGSFCYEGLLDGDGGRAKDPGDVVDDNALRAAWFKSLRLGL